MKIVLIGIQGSGKSTQGNLLSKQLIFHIYQPDIFFVKSQKKKHN